MRGVSHACHDFAAGAGTPLEGESGFPEVAGIIQPAQGAAMPFAACESFPSPVVRLHASGAIRKICRPWRRRAMLRWRARACPRLHGARTQTDEIFHFPRHKNILAVL
eukprot:2010588-Pyramimonas_sp.AAC.1